MVQNAGHLPPAGVEQLSRGEQLQLLATVERYLDVHIWNHRTLASTWTRGFQVHGEISVTDTAPIIRRASVDGFLQVAETGERMEAYRVSLVRHGDEAWQVFQTKRL